MFWKIHPSKFWQLMAQTIGKNLKEKWDFGLSGPNLVRFWQGGGEIVRISVVFLVYLDFPWYCPRVFQVFSCFSFATSCDFPEASLYFSRFFLFFSCFFLVFWETGEGGIEIVRFSVVFLVYLGFLGICLAFSWGSRRIYRELDGAGSKKLAPGGWLNT